MLNVVPVNHKIRGCCLFAVDKNKPRDVHARATNNRSSSPVPALAAGNKAQNAPRALVSSPDCYRFM